jgi:hypothetical protein
LPNAIDLESVVCVQGHVWDWANAVYQRAQRGPLRGLPVRTVVCLHCSSDKSEHLSWNGRVLNRSYDLKDEYILNARALDDDMHERRYHYNRLRILRALQPTPAELRKGGRNVDDDGELLEG